MYFPGARVPRRRRGRHHRGAGRARPTSSAPGRHRPHRRCAVWVLHAGHSHERLGPARAEARSQPPGDRRGALGESVPVHRLHQDLRGRGAGRGGAARARRGGGGAMKPPDPRRVAGARPDMEIPSDRIMPGDERLEPPQWPGGRSAPPPRGFAVIGKRNRKIEGLAKATGQALYADDLALPRMLHAKLLRSIHAHARIQSIDSSRALALPGVHAVITGKDLPEYYGIIPWTQDEQALCEEKTRYVGDAIAAVAAESELIAEEALRAIVVEYDPLPAVHDVDTAIAHPEWKVNEKAKDG